MTQREMTEVIDSVSKLDMGHMDMADQIKYLYAMNQFAESVKPLVLKYVNDMPKGSKFLFKM